MKALILGVVIIAPVALLLLALICRNKNCKS